LKLQHFLFKKGVFSRRESEKMIREGYVHVNGKIITDHLTTVLPSDFIYLNKKIFEYANRLGLVLFHKPPGVWTNCKLRENQKEVIDFLPQKFKMYSSIGRLDKPSEGLILFTNDGVFANQFLNSNQLHERMYHVWCKHQLTRQNIEQMQMGVLLTDGITQPCKITQINSKCYEFRLHEGKNRQIRRMIEVCNTSVTRLKRWTFSTYKLGNIAVGQWRFISLKRQFLIRCQPLLKKDSSKSF
jgi:pseudouridine synthase